MARRPPAHGTDLERRNFVKLCASAVVTVTASPEVLANGRGAGRDYARVTLLADEETGAPLRASEMTVGETYLFHYPYRTTPCFLLDLGRPVAGDISLETASGDRYVWHGGVGPARSIVAFAAICQHKMSHPARSVSFIDYRHDTATFRDDAYELVERPGVIYCCSEKSVYDPAAGARVLGGPAVQPLTTIALEYDPDADTLVATGTRGGEIYERFFEAFGHRLMLEYGTDRIREPVTGGVPIVPIAEFSERRRRC